MPLRFVLDAVPTPWHLLGKWYAVYSADVLEVPVTRRLVEAEQLVACVRPRDESKAFTVCQHLQVSSGGKRHG